MIIQRIYGDQSCIPAGVFSLSTGVAYGMLNYLERELIDLCGLQGTLIVIGELSFSCVIPGIIILYKEEGRSDFADSLKGNTVMYSEEIENNTMSIGDSTDKSSLLLKPILDPDEPQIEEVPPKHNSLIAPTIFDIFIYTIENMWFSVTSRYPWKDPVFVLTALVFHIYSCVFMPVLTYLPMISMQVTGVDKDNDTLLTVIFGLLATLVKIPLILLSSKGPTWRKWILLSSFALGCLSCSIIFFTTTYETYIIICFPLAVYMCKLIGRVRRVTVINVCFDKQNGYTPYVGIYW